jgi:hypothetical protein
MAITMRMVARICVFATKVTQGTRAIVKCPLYAHKTHTKVKVTLRNLQLQWHVALKIQTKTNVHVQCTHVVEVEVGGTCPDDLDLAGDRYRNLNNKKQIQITNKWNNGSVCSMAIVIHCKRYKSTWRVASRAC